MERTEIAIAQLINMKNPDHNTVHDLWYDWFCKSTSLDRKGRSLLSRLRTIAKKTTKFDLNKTYVFFKNNCPCYGDNKLYDDFRVCDIESGNVLYTITPKDPYGNATVWGRENKFAEPIVNGTWNDVKEFFKN